MLGESYELVVGGLGDVFAGEDEAVQEDSWRELVDGMPPRFKGDHLGVEGGVVCCEPSVTDPIKKIAKDRRGVISVADVILCYAVNGCGHRVDLDLRSHEAFEGVLDLALFDAYCSDL